MVGGKHGQGGAYGAECADCHRTMVIRERDMPVGRFGQRASCECLRSPALKRGSLAGEPFAGEATAEAALQAAAHLNPAECSTCH